MQPKKPAKTHKNGQKRGGGWEKGAIKQAEKRAKSQPAEGCNQGAIRVQLGCNQGAKGCNPKSVQKHAKTGPVGRASINTRLGEPVPSAGWANQYQHEVGRASINTRLGEPVSSAGWVGQYQA